MTSSNLKRKESNKKSSQRYYEKNKEAEKKKASERMRKLRLNRATEKFVAGFHVGGEASLSTELPKESHLSGLSSPTGDDMSDAGDSERSVTPDHLHWPTPEYLRDYEWEAQMEELNKRNEEERMRAEEMEVAALLVLDTDDKGDKAMGKDSDELEYVSDSEGDLLLSPPAGIQSPYGYR